MYLNIVLRMSRDIQEAAFARVVEEILGSWTALELAIAHYDGQYRAAQEKREELSSALCQVVPEEKYSVVDIAEYLAEYMLEKLFVELDDNSHVDVANLLLVAWGMIREGRVPVVHTRQSGAGASQLRSEIVEVEESDMPLTEHRQPQLQMEVDDDGWSTLVRK